MSGVFFFLFGVFVIYFLTRGVVFALFRPSSTAGKSEVAWDRILKIFFYLVLYAGWATLIDWMVEDWSDEAQTSALLSLQLIAPVFVFGWGPHWLAWRVLGPRGFVEAAALLLQVAIHRHRPDRPGAVALLREVYGAGSTGLDRAPVTAWTVCALAVRFERQGKPLRAGLQMASLRRLPADARVPRHVRIYGIEALAALAAARGDWHEVARRAGLGRGRGVRLFGALARRRTGRQVPAWWLWRCWTLAPARRATLPLVREALAGAQTSTVGTQEPSTASNPWLGHLRLLDRAARGEPFEIWEVLALARAWDGPLAPGERARLQQRGLELGVRDGSQAGEALLGKVLDELDLLLVAARGAWPVPGEGTLEAELRRRTRERLFARIAEREPFFSTEEAGRPSLAPCDEWEEWVRFRADVDRLEALGGEEALHTAWLSGLNESCDWAVYLFNRHRQAFAWGGYVMFWWAAETAQRVGDERTEQIFRKNAGVARKGEGVVS